MNELGDYDSGRTTGGKCGCAIAALLGLLFAFAVTGFAWFSCPRGADCRGDAQLLFWGGLAVSALVAAAIGLASRAAINSFIRWNHKPRERTPEQVAALLRAMLDGTASNGEIDDFISVDIADPRLDAIKDEVGLLYGHGWDSDDTRDRLTGLLRQVEAMPPEA